MASTFSTLSLPTSTNLHKTKDLNDGAAAIRLDVNLRLDPQFCNHKKINLDEKHHQH